MKRVLSLLLAVIICTLVVVPFTASAKEAEAVQTGSASVPNSVYIKQAESDTCTLAAATNMIRALFYINDNDSWSGITEASMKKVAWYKGLRGSFTYNIDGNSASVSMANVNGMSIATLKNLVDNHPEGVEIYSRGSQTHAVLVTDYVGDTFYCVDSDPGCDAGRIPLTSTVILARYGSQANILANIHSYWYISDCHVEPTNRRVDLGTDFYAKILNKGANMPLGYSSSWPYADSRDPVVIMPETVANNHSCFWHFTRGDNNTYTITQMANEKANVETSYLSLWGEKSTLACTNSPYITKWYFTGNETDGYKMYEEDGSKTKALDLNGGTTEGTGLIMKATANTNTQNFQIAKVIPTIHTLDHSLSISSTTIHKGEDFVVTLGGKTSYMYKVIFHIYLNGEKISTIEKYEKTLTYTADRAGEYKIYAEVFNPLYQESGSLTNKCVTVTTIGESDGVYDCSLLADGTLMIDKYNGTATDLVIPSTINGKTVTAIGDEAFKECNTLVKVKLPDTIKTIGNSAFNHCNNLEEFIFSDTVPTIGYGMFGGCVKLTKVTFPKGMKKVPDNMFIGCTGITSLDFIKGMTEIGNGAFAKCTGLTSIEIPEGVTKIDGFAFFNCNSKTIIIPADVTEISVGSSGLDAFGVSEYSEEFRNSIVIYGVPGSAAEAYAKHYDVTFKDINERPQPTEPPTEAPKTKLGDADGDETVSIFDATVIQRKVAGIPVATYVAAAADVDGDGDVTVVDATTIQRYLAGLDSPKNIGELI